MLGQAYVIVRDPRGSLIHVRTKEGECIGCIEVGLYEVVRALLMAEREGPPEATREVRE